MISTRTISVPDVRPKGVFAWPWRPWLAGTLACSLVGCTTMKLNPPTARSMDTYPQRQSHEGLTVAIEPITDPRDCKKRFGMNLLSVRILPVFIVAQNQNDAASFILNRERVALGIAQQDAKGVLDQKEARSKDTAEALGYTTAGLILLSPALAIPTLIAFLKQASDYTVINTNFKMSEFRSTTLSPGEIVHGYVYFEIPKDTGLPAHSVVYLEALNPVNQTNMSFALPLEVEGKLGGKRK
jgi:hypothetical protein